MNGSLTNPINPDNMQVWAPCGAECVHTSGPTGASPWGAHSGVAAGAAWEAHAGKCGWPTVGPLWGHCGPVIAGPHGPHTGPHQNAFSPPLFAHTLLFLLFLLNYLLIDQKQIPVHIITSLLHKINNLNNKQIGLFT